MKQFNKIFMCTSMFAMLLVSSCGGGLNGKYKGEGPMGISTMEIEFKGGGKALLTGGAIGMTSTQELKYEKDGDQVKLIVGEQIQVLTIDKEGCLNGMGTKLCKE